MQPSDGSGPSDDEGDPPTFESLFKDLSERWLNVQLTHHVSLEATAALWKLAFSHVSEITALKAQENINRKIPQYVHVRRQIYKEVCPRVTISFAFLNKADGSITKVQEDCTPLNKFQRDPQYQKLYEAANVEVMYILYFMISISF